MLKQKEVESLAYDHGVSEVHWIDSPFWTVNGRAYQVQTFRDINVLFEEADGGDVYIMKDQYRGFAVKPETGCQI